MPPIGSTPSKPASFTALNLSRTEPFIPMVSYIIPFLIERFLPEAAEPSAARSRGGVKAAAAMASPVWATKERRLIFFMVLKWVCEAETLRGLLSPKGGEGEEERGMREGEDGLAKSGLAGHGDFDFRSRCFPGDVIRNEFLLRIHGHVPGDFFAGVSGHTSHNAGHGAGAHTIA